MEHIIAKLVQEFEHGRLSRRELIQSLAAVAASSIATSPAAAAQPKGRVFTATAFNHVSYQVADYRKSRDFYAGLFGMQVAHDNGGECELVFGNNILIVRNRDRGIQQSPAQPSGTPRVDHIAYTVAGWDTDKSVKLALKAELERRGLQVREAAVSHKVISEPNEIHGRSFLVTDPDGFPVQMGGKDQ